MTLKTNTIAAQLRHAKERVERLERQLEIARALTSQANEDYSDLVSAINSDSYAISFQAFSQYRAGLLTLSKEIKRSQYWWYP